MACNVPQDGFQSPLLWISSVLVAIGFIANYYAWATFFSNDFSVKHLSVLALSYLVGLAASPLLRITDEISLLSAVLSPALSGLAWFLTSGTQESDFSNTFASLKAMGLYVPLFIVFLIAGSPLRGIVDLGQGNPNLRWGSSVLIGLAMFGCFYWFCKKSKLASESRNKAPSSTYAKVEQAVFKSWMILVFLFLLGLFSSLVLPQENFGGDVVVIARSFLDFFLWVLLCNLAQHKKLSPILLFTLCSMFVEAISWCLSYLVVPALLNHNAGEQVPLQNHIELVVVFALFSAVTVIFSLIIRKQSREVARIASSKTAPKSMPQSMAKQYGLTKREIEITDLFVQGKSLRKVAETLVISTSTAQTHIKNVYRKLDIHSKDELVDVLDAWNASDLL